MVEITVCFTGGSHSCGRAGVNFSLNRSAANVPPILQRSTLKMKVNAALRHRGCSCSGCRHVNRGVELQELGHVPLRELGQAAHASHMHRLFLPCGDLQQLQVTLVRRADPYVDQRPGRELADVVRQQACGSVHHDLVRRVHGAGTVGHAPEEVNAEMTVEVISRYTITAMRHAMHGGGQRAAIQLHEDRTCGPSSSRRRRWF